MNLELSFTMRVANTFEKREELGTFLHLNNNCCHVGVSRHTPWASLKGPLPGAKKSKESLGFGVRWIGFKSKL